MVHIIVEHGVDFSEEQMLRLSRFILEDCQLMTPEVTGWLKAVRIRSESGAHWLGYWAARCSLDESAKIESIEAIIVLNAFYLLTEKSMHTCMAHHLGHHYTVGCLAFKHQLDVLGGASLPESYYSLRGLDKKLYVPDYSKGWNFSDKEVIAEDYRVLFTPFVNDHSMVADGILPPPSSEVKAYLQSLVETPTFELKPPQYALIMEYRADRILVTPVSIPKQGPISVRETSGPILANVLLPANHIFLPSEVEEFEELLNNAQASEPDFHSFFLKYPKFLYAIGNYEDIRSEVILKPQILLDDRSASDMRADFFLKRIGLNVWDIAELKLPWNTIVVGSPNRRMFSSTVREAIAQIEEYRNFFRDLSNLQWFRDKYGMEVTSPNLYVIIGRAGAFQSLDERDRIQDREQVRIVTYDDLHRFARNRIIEISR